MIPNYMKRANAAAPNMFEVWIIGAGGGGGFNIGGGGGAGQVLKTWLKIVPGGEYIIDVGVGGLGGTSVAAAGTGESSSWENIVALGGGGGGSNGLIGLLGASSGGDSGRTSGTVASRTEGTDAKTGFRGGIYVPSGTISGGAGGGGSMSSGVNATASGGSKGGEGSFYFSPNDSYWGWGGCGGGSGQTGATLTAGTGPTGSGGTTNVGEVIFGPHYGSGGHGGGRSAAGIGRQGGPGANGAVVLIVPNSISTVSWGYDGAFIQEQVYWEPLKTFVTFWIFEDSGTLTT